MSILGIILVLTTIIYSIVLVLFLIGLAHRKQLKNQFKHSISVVMAARNEEHNIHQCLTDLSNQTYPADKYEVVIVDDHSSDKTVEMIQAFVDRFPNFHLVQPGDIPPNFSPKKYALTTGIARSGGEIILAVDADCRVEPTWIETMNSYFTPEVGMVIGFSQLRRPNQLRTFFEKLQAFDFLQLMAAAAGTANLGYPLAASGQNLGFRRSAFQEVNGYQEVAHCISGDDILLMQLIKHRTNWRIVFALSKLAFNSSHPQPSLNAFLQQRRRWASNGKMQIYLDKPFFIFMIVTYIMNLFLLFGIPLALFSVAAGAVVWHCLLAKVTAELALALQGVLKFHRADLLPIFPFWTLLEIPYIVVAGGLGSIASFTWKERIH